MTRDYLALKIHRELVDLVAGAKSQDEVLDRLVAVFEETCVASAASILGSKGGRPKKSALNRFSGGDSVSERVVTETDSDSEKTQSPAETASKRFRYPEAFEAFWTLADGKGSKANALKEWQKLSAAERELLAPALAWQKLTHDWLKEKGRYRLDTERWLKYRRFEDEAPSAKPKPRTPGAGLTPELQARLKHSQEQLARVQGRLPLDD